MGSLPLCNCGSARKSAAPPKTCTCAIHFDAFGQTYNYFTSRAGAVLGTRVLRCPLFRQPSNHTILRKIEVNPLPEAQQWHTRDQRTASKKIDEPF
jgi:hypothetical protein